MATWIDAGASVAALTADWLTGISNHKASFSDGQKAPLEEGFQSLGKGFGQLVAERVSFD